MADTTFDEVVKLADPLTPDEKLALINHLRQQAKERQLTPDERIALIEEAISDIPFLEEPSPRREDLCITHISENSYCAPRKSGWSPVQVSPQPASAGLR